MHVLHLTLIIWIDIGGVPRDAIVSEDDEDGLLAVVVVVALCEANVAAVVVLSLA